MVRIAHVSDLHDDGRIAALEGHVLDPATSTFRSAVLGSGPEAAA